MLSTVKGTLAAAVATAGTFTVGYPTGKDRGSFQAGVLHRLSIIGKVFSAPEDMTLSFGATSVTVTYNGATTLPSGSAFTFQFDEPGFLSPVVDITSGAVIHVPVDLVLVNLGSPAVAAANAVFLSAAITAIAPITAGTGAMAFALDARTGRALVAAWTGTAVMTITGKDMYGRTIVEASASGTSFTGKKAFKTITSIAVSADVTACTVGTSNILGMPIYLGNAAYVLKESQDNAAATAGTLVAGLTLATKPTSTNADVRGTYLPNSAPDSSKSYVLLCAVPDRGFLGAAQFAG